MYTILTFIKRKIFILARLIKAIVFNYAILCCNPSAILFVFMEIYVLDGNWGEVNQFDPDGRGNTIIESSPAWGISKPGITSAIGGANNP